MGGFFGTVSKHDAISDVFFGTDYHSHLGTRRAGIAAFDRELGLQNEVHNIEASPFRTKFANIFDTMRGNSAIGCISDADPQPLLIRSNLGKYAICVIGVINNSEALIDKFLTYSNGHFDIMTNGNVNIAELVAAMINQKNTYVDGIKFAQKEIEGTASILILKDDGALIAARDRYGRLPVLIGKSKKGYCVSFESFAYLKLDYEDELELGPGEIVEVSTNGIKQLAEPGDEMHICAFLWSYYGYPTSVYEGVNVETMRYRNGEIMANDDTEKGINNGIDYVSGVPDSGTPHAIGYANASHIPFARPFIKYTPTWARSFTPSKQAARNKIAKMKQIPVHELIKGKSLLFVDDSIVRGTQLKETVDFLYNNGAKAVHMRSACPPVMHSCKYLNFSRTNNDNELITRRTILELEGEEGLNHLEEYSNSDTERGKALRKAICDKLDLSSLEFQTLDGLIRSIGIPECKLCTYCWNKKG